MRHLIMSLMAASILTTPMAISAQELSSTPPAIPAQKPFHMPASETYTLSNGMMVTLIPYGVTPKTVVSLQVAAGTAHDGPDTWIASLTMDMVREGAAGMTSAQIAQKFADMGGSLSSSAASNSSGITTNVLAERAADAISLIADIAQRPTFPEAELARTKVNWNRRLAIGLTQPGVLANAAITRAYYGTDHPYGRVLPTPEQFNAYDSAKLKAWHAANFGAKRAHLYVAGQFDAKAVKAAIEKAFGGWAAGPDKQLIPVNPKPGPQVLLVDRPGAPQSTISIMYAAPKAGDAMDIPTRVMNALLGGAFSSRITRNIREEKGFTYSPGSSFILLPTNSVWSFNADVTTASTGASLTEVFKEMRTLAATPPGDEEGNGMRQYQAGLFVIRNATPGALVSTLATRDSLGLPRDWVDSYVPSTLAVTNEQISEAARQFPVDKLTMVVVGDLKVVRPQLEALPELKGVPLQTVTVP